MADRVPFLCSIIVHYGSISDTRRTLESLSACRTDGWSHEVLLVDNSSDRALSVLAGTHHVIHLDHNRGFGAACNVGIEHAASRGADYFLLLNNDVAIRSNALAELRQGILRHPNAGILGGTVLYADPPGHVWFAGGRIRPWLMRTEHVGIDRPAAAVSSPEGSTDFVTGTFMAVSARAIARLGGFDEQYFLYCEDTDLCIRAARAQVPVVYLPEVICVHRVGGGHISAPSPTYLYYATRNRFRLFRKGHSWLRRVYVAVACMLVYGLFRIAIVLTTRRAARWRSVGAIASGTWDGLRAKWGRRGATF